MMVMLLFLVIGYLIGSFCSAVIISRVFSLPDPRKEGSKNPGATNILRLAGKKYAAIVLLADALKGLLPVLAANLLTHDPSITGFTCLAAVAGHMYPAFFDFQGGKGVATAMGGLLAIHFPLGISVIATWLVVAHFSRYSSLASLVSMALAPLYALVMLGTLTIFTPLFFLLLAITYKHKANITRLVNGEEPTLRFHTGTITDLFPLEKRKKK